jgi:hypothetical protein
MAMYAMLRSMCRQFGRRRTWSRNVSDDDSLRSGLCKQKTGMRG